MLLSSPGGIGTAVCVFDSINIVLLTNENAALIPEGRRNFSLLQNAKPGSGAYQPPIPRVPGFLPPGAKRLGLEAGH
jgi:hypothetical protein